MIQIEWKELLLLIGAGNALIGGLLVGYLQYRLSSVFAKVGDLSALAERVGNLEAKMASMPDHDDIRELLERIGRVETAAAVTKDATTRIERQVDLLVQYHMKEPS